MMKCRSRTLLLLNYDPDIDAGREEWWVQLLRRRLETVDLLISIGVMIDEAGGKGIELPAELLAEFENLSLRIVRGVPA